MAFRRWRTDRFTQVTTQGAGRGQLVQATPAAEAPGDEPERQLLLDEPGLAACYAPPRRASVRARAGTARAQARIRQLRALESADRDLDAPVAGHRDLNVYAEQCVDVRDRKRLERLIRYVTRPIAQDLERLYDLARQRYRNDERNGELDRQCIVLLQCGRRRSWQGV